MCAMLFIFVQSPPGPSPLLQHKTNAFAFRCIFGRDSARHFCERTSQQASWLDVGASVGSERLRDLASPNWRYFCKRIKQFIKLQIKLCSKIISAGFAKFVSQNKCPVLRDFVQLLARKEENIHMNTHSKTSLDLRACSTAVLTDGQTSPHPSLRAASVGTRVAHQRTQLHTPGAEFTLPKPCSPPICL